LIPPQSGSSMQFSFCSAGTFAVTNKKQQAAICMSATTDAEQQKK